MSAKASIEHTSFKIEESSFTDPESITSANDLLLPLSEKDAKVEQLAEQHNINHKKLMWKIDLCVVPPFCLLYFLAFLDRVNISNAKIYGMEESLHLSSNQFSAALTVFFVPYIVFEVLSNFLLKVIKPHTWLSAMILLFGVVTICMAYSRNYGGLIVCRLFLGIFEAGSFPSIFYIMANFYSSRESQRRFSFFFSCTCLAGGCAGALAYRIHDLNGKFGLHSWQWIYIIEGAFTAGLAIVLYFIIPDFPEECRFLNENERTFLKKKLEIYTGKSGYEIKQTWKDVSKVFKDPVIYICAICYFCFIVPAYSYAFFAPTIIGEMGYVAMEAQRHSIYPWLASMGFSIVIAFISDYLYIRVPFAILASLISICGFGMVIGATNDPMVRYGGCFMLASGLYTAMPVLVCWFSLNFAGHTRKSVGTAFIIGFGNIGGIVASFIFPNKEAPRYIKGLSISLSFVVLALIIVVVYCGYLMFRNRAKRSPEYRAQWDQLDDREKVMRGDLNPDFKYLY
jgi:sugar phosphate permease